MKHTILVLLVFAVVGCNINFSSNKVKESRKAFSFNQALKLDDLGFATTDTTIINALAADDKNNLYILGYFEGVLDGVTAQGNDIFLVKVDADGKLVWRKHFREGKDGILNSSGADEANALTWDQSSRSVYFVGQTKSSLIEENQGGNSDLILAKISEHGASHWIRHYGKETQDKLGNNLANNESAGSVQISPQGDVIVTFQTNGTFFDTHQGGMDAGVFKASPNNGDIIIGRQIGGTGDESITQSIFAFDGNKIVIPIRTKSSLADTVGGTDAGYFVVDENFTASVIRQLGQNAYSAWANANSVTGSIAQEDQFRAVVVNAPGDYLFYGKTSSNMADTKMGADYFFARYQNNELVSIIQYGQNTLPEAISDEEPRYMFKAENGQIYCAGFTRSSLFEPLDGNRNSIVFSVDSNGSLLDGVQVGTETSVKLGIDVNTYNLVLQANFIARDGSLILASNSYASGSSSGPARSYIWRLNSF
jgi:hypothetical protein